MKHSHAVHFLLAIPMKLVAFDAFNTLFRLKDHPGITYAKVASRYGVAVDKLRSKTQFVSAYREMASSYPNFGYGSGILVEDWWKRVVFTTLTEAGASKQSLDPVIDELALELFRYYQSRDAVVKFDDVDNTLRRLQSQNVVLGVISNSDSRTTHILESIGIRRYFKFILLSHEVGFMKPDRRIFDEARQSAEYQSALYVGDDFEKDSAAMQAGWSVKIIDRTESLQPSIQVIKSLNEVYLIKRGMTEA